MVAQVKLLQTDTSNLLINLIVNRQLSHSNLLYGSKSPPSKRVSVNKHSQVI